MKDGWMDGWTNNKIVYELMMDGWMDKIWRKVFWMDGG